MNLIKCISFGKLKREIIESSLIGRVRDVFTAKTMLTHVKGQDGGVVTSMLLYALEEGLIDSAVVTVKSEEDPWKPCT